MESHSAIRAERRTSTSSPRDFPALFDEVASACSDAEILAGGQEGTGEVRRTADGGTWAIQDAADELRKASATLVEENAVTNNVKAEMENVVTEGASRTLLLAPLQVWATMRGIIDENAATLEEVAEELYAKTANARMAIALARLHTAQTAQFSTESSADESMRLLVDALEVDVREMDDAVFLHSSFRRRVELKVNSISELTKIPLEMIRRWSQNTNESTMGAEVMPLVEQVNKAMEAADNSIAQLQQASEKLAQAPSTDEVRAALERLNSAVQ